MYLGDFAVGATVRLKFTTVDKTTPGAPASLTSGAAAVYKGGSATESTAGVTLTADYDSVTGLHAVDVDLSADGTFYAAGGEFAIVLTAGTVDSVSVAGYVVGHFSIQNRYGSAPSANAVADALLDRTDGVETGWTVRKTLRVMAAALAGKLSGAGSNAPVFRNLTDSKARITATTDSSGNRTAVTLDGD